MNINNELDDKFRINWIPAKNARITIPMLAIAKVRMGFNFSFSLIRRILPISINGKKLSKQTRAMTPNVSLRNPSVNWVIIIKMMERIAKMLAAVIIFLDVFKATTTTEMLN